MNHVSNKVTKAPYYRSKRIVQCVFKCLQSCLQVKPHSTLIISTGKYVNQKNGQ